MDDKTWLALFVGGSADGWMSEIGETPARLKWEGSYYLLRGTLDTGKFGTVRLYILEGMSGGEERQRLEILKKVL